jgi:hypothetical protein
MCAPPSTPLNSCSGAAESNFLRTWLGIVKDLEFRRTRSGLGSARRIPETCSGFLPASCSHSHMLTFLAEDCATVPEGGPGSRPQNRREPGPGRVHALMSGVQKDGHVGVVSDGQVGKAIEVEVGADYTRHSIIDKILLWRSERPVAVS